MGKNKPNDLFYNRRIAVTPQLPFEYFFFFNGTIQHI